MKSLYLDSEEIRIRAFNSSSAAEAYLNDESVIQEGWSLNNVLTTWGAASLFVTVVLSRTRTT